MTGSDKKPVQKHHWVPAGTRPQMRQDLFQQHGIKSVLLDTPDRQYWRDIIKRRRLAVEMAEHEIRIAQRRLSEARVERDNRKIALSAARIELNKLRR